MRTFQPFALAAGICASAVACKSSEQHLDVTIGWSDTKQTVDGFGASSAFFGENITNAVADQLFDAKKGIGLSLLRTVIGLPGDTQEDGSEPVDGAKPIATSPGLTTALQATLRGAKVWATAWTPPPIWKTTNNKNGSGTGYTSNKLDPAHYQDYAGYLADFVDLMAKNNVPIVGVSPANEPDYTATWDNAQWTPDELTTFISQNMGPTFAQRFPSVKIIAPDTAGWSNVDLYLTPLLADAAGKNYVSVVATHPYGVGSLGLDYKKPAQNGKQFWQSEWSQENAKGDTPNPTMTSAMDMMQHLHEHMVISNMNAWNWWAIYISADALASADIPKVRQNPALIQPDASFGESYMFKRGYALGNWSKFVRPGFQRVGATEKPAGGVLIEAYRDATHIAVIAINTTSKTVAQKFILDGATFGTLTPWVTSPDDNLAAKSPITAADSFSYDLPASSVVTFVNWDATTETPGQGPLPGDNVDGGTDVRISTGLDCSNAWVPNNVVNGGVTDFSDWTASFGGRWGDPAGLWGNIYAYKGPNGSTMNAAVENQALHVTGSVTAGDYGGAGLGYQVCTTVASFTHVQFTLSGSSPGCDIELQIKTFDQQPKQQTPPGGCDQNAVSCYNFPVKKQVAVATAQPTVITTPLADFTNWSAANAAQVVGIQWQFTGTNVDPDAGAGCPIDLSISGIRFLQSGAVDAATPDAATSD